MREPTSTPTRRAVLAGLAALAGVSAAGPAAAQFAGSFRAIVVDTAPLQALGAGSTAALVRPVMQRELARAFAGRVTGAHNAPTLVVRITAVSLSGYSGAGGSARGGGDTDYIDGQALIVPPGGGAPIAAVSLLSAVPSSSAGAYYTAGNEPRRVIYLCSHAAGWLARRV